MEFNLPLRVTPAFALLDAFIIKGIPKDWAQRDMFWTQLSLQDVVS